MRDAEILKLTPDELALAKAFWLVLGNRRPFESLTYEESKLSYLFGANFKEIMAKHKALLPETQKMVADRLGLTVDELLKKLEKEAAK